MQELYESAAEPMPDSFSATGVWDVDTMVDHPDEYAQVWQPSQTLPEQIQALSATDLGVPVRHLPHGRVHDLYLQFLSWYDANVGGKGGEGHDGREAKGPASYSTFHRHWQTTWAGCLKFRKVAQHSTCQECFELKKSMHAARGDLAAKVQYAGKLREHLKAQYQDRCLYWSLRWASRQYQDVLVIIVDSMDKTKFGIPRYKFSERPKELDGFIRPKLVCTAALAHGWRTMLFLSDDVVNHGGDAFAEVVLQVLEEVAEVAKSTGRTVPRHLVIQSDNTTAQCKNSLGAMFMATLVAKFKFVTANLMFLRVGHTHEDVGGALGVHSHARVRTHG